MTVATIAAYGAYATAYRDGHHDLSDYIRSELDEFVAVVGAGSRVLEIGSGGGRDAAYLKAQGLEVCRTDVTPAFVDLLRQAGYGADVLDPLCDNLSDPAQPNDLYDAVWANACLLHVQRVNLPTVLTRLCLTTRHGGSLRFSVKEGEGEAWANSGPVGAPRLFIYWMEPALRAVAERAGWIVRQVKHFHGPGADPWLGVWATWLGVWATR